MPETTQPDVKPARKRVRLAITTILAAMVLYPLTVGPLAFLEGTGLIDQKTIEAIRPMYAPLKPLVTQTRAGGLLINFERQSQAFGSRFRK